MKKICSVMLAVMLLAGMFAGCSVNVESITLPADMEIEAGDTFTLVAEVLPENATDKTVTWTSNNEAIAKVDENGLLYALAPGDAVITASGGNDREAKINVQVIVTLASIEVESEMLLEVGETKALHPTPKPDNATDVDFTYASSDMSVVKVEPDGTVEAVARGEADITITSGEVSTVIQILVQQPVEKLILDKTEAQLSVGHSFTLVATIAPEEADIWTKISWRSSDENVATVDKNGLVTGIAAGTCEIIVENEQGISAGCTITVVRASSTGGSTSGGGGQANGGGGTGGGGSGGSGTGGSDGGGTGGGGGGGGGGNTTPSYNLSTAVSVGIAHAQSLGFTVHGSAGGWSYPPPVTPTPTSSQEQVNAWVIEMVNHVHYLVTEGGELPLYEGTGIWIYESGGLIYAAY